MLLNKSQYATAKLLASAARRVARRRITAGPGRPAWRFVDEIAIDALREGMERVAAEGPLAIRRFADTHSPPSWFVARTRRWRERIAGVPVVRFVPHGRIERTVLYLHGGAYVFGSAITHGDLAARLAHAAQAQVVVPEYRLAPEHPFPAAWDDAFAVYDALLAGDVEPRRLVVAGDSAGGGLSASLLVRVRDAGRPLPAGLALISPWVDPSEDLEPAPHDWLPPSFAGLGAHYAREVPLDDPRVAPLHADLRGLPPLLVQVGGAEVLREQGRRFADRARALGVEVHYDEAPDQVHVWHLLAGFSAAARAGIARLADFARRRTP